MNEIAEVTRINMWSGPRNVSTALMYSFARRDDTRVLDEPLYGHYLRVSDAVHPGAEEVMAAMDTDGERVIRNVILGPCDRAVLFMKQMAHHLVDISVGFLAQTTNVLLIRDPEQMLPSLAQTLDSPTLRDTGLALQTELFGHLRQIGQEPPILDAKELLSDPRSVLSQLCVRMGILFQDSMLSWPAGPIPEDGVWAKHWYDSVHTTTGFLPYREKTAPFPAELRPLLEECRPHYELLSRRAIRA
ncbi:MAG: sulfotransferase family protein [Caldilineaceae bacterium]